MSSGSERKGRCLCGAVTLTTGTAEKDVGACHCNMCRQWCSGPLIALNCGTDVSISGAESISVFDSSEWAERAFCNRCGSSLFYRLKHSGEHIVSAGLFEDADDLNFATQVFIDEKPPFYSFAENTKNLTGPEVFALYGGS